MHTSNVATITPSIGGVGHNVALAAHRAGGGLSVRLRSLVSEDLYINHLYCLSGD
jgi:pseudouridine-5'-phosphate glycosidase/pseudouridine kinase